MALRNAVRRVQIAGLATVLITAAGLAITAGQGNATAEQPVAYHGYHLSVPVNWPVIDLTAHPHTCVRGDQHAVYLGPPGRDQQCDTRAVGRTESILIEPLDTTALAGIRNLQVLDSHQAVPDHLVPSVDHEQHLAVPAAGVLV